MLRSLIVWIALAGCSSAGKQSPAPLPGESPPMTKDPGAVIDEPSLQDSPPPGPAGGGSGAGSENGPQQTGRADGATCLAATECASGVCEGQGCAGDQPGRCMEKSRMCTRDLRAYCGCDGNTFRASGSCPGQRFSARKACGG